MLDYGACLYFTDVAKIDMSNVTISNCMSNASATGIIIDYPNSPVLIKYTVLNKLISEILKLFCKIGDHQKFKLFK